MQKNSFLFLTTAAVVLSSPVFAGTKVYSPNVVKSEFELEYRGNFNRDKDYDKDRAQKHKYAIGYGFTDYYASEIYLIAENSGQKSYETKEIEWANRFQLTEQGKNFADVGLYLSFVKSIGSEGHDEAEAKILLEKQIGKFVNRINLGVEKELRKVNNEKAGNGAELGVDWMTKYSYKKSFEPGFEYHVNFGNYADKHNGYRAQEHQVGPAFYGKIGNFKYDVGLLFGTSKVTVDRQIKWNLEYEFF